MVRGDPVQRAVNEALCLGSSPLTGLLWYLPLLFIPTAIDETAISPLKEIIAEVTLVFYAACVA